MEVVNALGRRKKKEKPLSAPIANENTRHTPSDEKKQMETTTDSPGQVQ